MTTSTAAPIMRRSGVLAAGVSKTYGAVRALDGVDFSVSSGEVHALLGANGAGKSTLLKVITGAVEPDDDSLVTINGEVLYPGRGLGVRSPREMGLRVLHQEAPLLEDLTVAENIGLAHGFALSAGMISRRRMREHADQLLAEYDVEIASGCQVRTLSGAERASLGLAITLGHVGDGPRTLILDEATAMLSTAEGDRFLTRVRHAANQGASVVFVTHRLHEVEMIADRVTVLRGGRLVHTGQTSDIDREGLVRSMIGSDRLDLGVAPARTRVVEGEQVLEVSDLVADGVDHVSLSVRAGEVVGLSGRTSSGASRLAALIGGAQRWSSGEMRQFGRKVKPGSRAAIARGCAYLPADRLGLSGDPRLSLADNMVLPRTSEYWGRLELEKRDVLGALGDLSVEPSEPWRPLAALSGGNQQRVLLGKWLLTEPRLLVLEEPTFGVDVHAADIINRRIRDLADAGRAVLVASGDADQLLAVCSRVLIMRDGRIVDELSGARINREELNLAHN
ncbi:sugar ABC transporter ATP-binding protein [Microbacterium aquimaris]|uniref:sugar ABC transporter ATP-binding protein n=1 Tax=Microbacterium aquimaris TaxID=459816 RepID=UPI002AD266CE|nr:sugar ABC transporter ATP-binding protein [Microbacterium aquimaris]MDZ8274832.1 sugar ABC transporter ATP-binding protein [Microbacterium aquimaris]